MKIGIIGMPIAAYEIAHLCHNIDKGIVIISNAKKIEQVQQEFSSRKSIPIVAALILEELHVHDILRKEKYASQTWKAKHKKF